MCRRGDEGQPAFCVGAAELQGGAAGVQQRQGSLRSPLQHPQRAIATCRTSYRSLILVSPSRSTGRRRRRTYCPRTSTYQDVVQEEEAYGSIYQAQAQEGRPREAHRLARVRTPARLSLLSHSLIILYPPPPDKLRANPSTSAPPPLWAPSSSNPKPRSSSTRRPSRKVVVAVRRRS